MWSLTPQPLAARRAAISACASLRRCVALRAPPPAAQPTASPTEWGGGPSRAATAPPSLVSALVATATPSPPPSPLAPGRPLAPNGSASPDDVDDGSGDGMRGADALAPSLSAAAAVAAAALSASAAARRKNSERTTLSRTRAPHAGISGGGGRWRSARRQPSQSMMGRGNAMQRASQGEGGRGVRLARERQTPNSAALRTDLAAQRVDDRERRVQWRKLRRGTHRRRGGRDRRDRSGGRGGRRPAGGAGQRAGGGGGLTVVAEGVDRLVDDRRELAVDLAEQHRADPTVAAVVVAATTAAGGTCVVTASVEPGAAAAAAVPAVARARRRLVKTAIRRVCHGVSPAGCRCLRLRDVAMVFVWLVVLLLCVVGNGVPAERVDTRERVDCRAAHTCLALAARRERREEKEQPLPSRPPPPNRERGWDIVISAVRDKGRWVETWRPRPRLRPPDAGGAIAATV